MTIRHSHRRALGIGAVLALLIAAGAAYWAFRVWPVFSLAVPDPDLSGADPQVVQSIQTLRAAVRDAPSSDQPWGKLGIAFMAGHWYEEALACFQQAATFNSQELRWVYLPAMILEQSDREAAARAYARAAAVDPKYAPLRYRWGSVLLRLDRPDEAKEQFQECARLAPRDPYPLIGLARLAASAGDYATARVHLERAVSVAPANREAHQELARVYFRLGDMALAEQDQQIAARLQQDTRGMADQIAQEVESMQNATRRTADRADELVRRGELAAAATAYRELIRERPDLVRPRLNLATTVMMQGNLPAAIAMYRETVEAFPNDASAHYGLASALETAGDIDGAIEGYRRCTQLKPDYAQAFHALGLLLQQKGDVREATRSFRLAVQSDPRLAQAHLALGIALQEGGDLEGAIDHMRSAVRFAPPGNDLVPRQYLEQAIAAKKQASGKE